ncbi:MAG: RNA polymerase sigma factor [Frankiales bacterium]|nr:MAG: RNA polymerase sigma factor [Frankiales bacterium]
MSSMLDLPHPDEAALLATLPAQPAPLLRAVPDPVEEPLDFDEVVRRLTPRLQRYATRRLGDRHEAEELVQEALLRAFDHRAELATEDDVAAWTTCVTGRLVIDRLRVRGRSTSVAEVPEGTRVGRDTADVVVARDEARLALDALDAMPPRQAAVLWAREVEGLAYDAIGERFGMTEPAVRSVLMRARKALRREFATRGGTLPAGGLVALAPWLDGLTWVERLRRMAGRAAAPAAAGAATLGLIGGVLVPWGSTDIQLAPERAVVVAAQDVSSARTLLTQAPTPAAAAVQASRDLSASAIPARAAQQGVLKRLGVVDSCVTAESDENVAQVPLVGTVGGPATAGGTSCDSQQDSAILIGPELPSNPTGIKRLGVESYDIDCTVVPTTPLTQCTTSGDS